jgi:hypothetical protein
VDGPVTTALKTYVTFFSKRRVTQSAATSDGLFVVGLQSPGIAASPYLAVDGARSVSQRGDLDLQGFCRCAPNHGGFVFTTSLPTAEDVYTVFRTPQRKAAESPGGRHPQIPKTPVKRGEFYLSENGTRDQRKQRVFVVLSRPALIESRFSSVICEPVYSRHDGLSYVASPPTFRISELNSGRAIALGLDIPAF